MSQSLAKILVHIVFSTKNRAPVIDSNIRPQLYAAMAGIVNDHDSHALRVGGTADHVHLAVDLGRTIQLAELVKILKRSSNRWLRAKSGRFENFHWQAGYGAFSIARSQLDQLIHYIDQQEEHHRVRTFKEEYLDLLAKYKLEPDERYLWE
ncbi:IS200/IS605 family transposase [Persicirhabdus sediminis]|uniref:IS200/IS605 family transposase n=1 Tax=Persicirhabdus sediminis TaxID=454144 RepID=A0A8J7ME34_9BACT|nr:IS200/IS605 family transposase [Persicirhabdus sediminis]MBK1791672.1 IS200/IS605 family transposase [Persicirhabdus sediminis]